MINISLLTLVLKCHLKMENNLCESLAVKALTVEKVSFDKSCKTFEDHVKMAKFKREFRSVTRNLLTDFDKETGGKNKRKRGSMQIGVVTRRKISCFRKLSNNIKLSLLSKII